MTFRSSSAPLAPAPQPITYPAMKSASREGSAASRSPSMRSASRRLSVSRMLHLVIRWMLRVPSEPGRRTAQLAYRRRAGRAASMQVQGVLPVAVHRAPLRHCRLCRPLLRAAFLHFGGQKLAAVLRDRVARDVPVAHESDPAETMTVRAVDVCVDLPAHGGQRPTLPSGSAPAGAASSRCGGGGTRPWHLPASAPGCPRARHRPSGADAGHACPPGRTSGTR
jgi:hypothetical protein